MGLPCALSCLFLLTIIHLPIKTGSAIIELKAEQISLPQKIFIIGGNMLMRNKIIAAVRNYDELICAADSDVKIVFDLNPNILTLADTVNILHEAGKKCFVHIDLAEGIGKDRSGIEYMKKKGVDGIISTRTGTIKIAKDLGLFTVQRFFIVDSRSVNTTIESWKTSKAQMIEIMPGNILKVIPTLKEIVEVPIITGGLIETEQEAMEAIKCGASAVSTGQRSLWSNKD